MRENPPSDFSNVQLCLGVRVKIGMAIYLLHPDQIDEGNCPRHFFFGGRS